MPRQRYSGGGVGGDIPEGGGFAGNQKYYENSSGDGYNPNGYEQIPSWLLKQMTTPEGVGGVDIPPANMGDDPSYPNDPNPSATVAPSGEPDGSGFPGGGNPSTQAGGPPTGNGAPPQGIGDLVQPPDLPAVYNQQPMPTWMRFMPPAAQAAYWAVRGVQRIGDMYHNSHLNQGQPGQQAQPGQQPQGSGLSSPFLNDLGGLGKPMGYFPPTGGFGHDTRNGYDPTGPMGPIGTSGIVDPNSPAGGGSFFGGRGSPIVPGSGFLNNESSLPTLAGGHSDYGADMALHSGAFRNAIANAQYINPNFSMGMPKGMAGGQGIGGGGLPMKQNFSDGGVAQPTPTPDPTPDNRSYFLKDLGYKTYGEWLRALFTGHDDQGNDVATRQKDADGGVAGDERNQEASPMSPEEMAKLYREYLIENEQKRKLMMNEEGGAAPLLSDLEQQIAAQGKGKTDMSFHSGGMVPRMGKSYAMGGNVSKVAPMQQLQGMGTDTVPAALTPGEVILNKQQQSAVMPRPGMKRKLKPEQLAAIEIAMRKKSASTSGQSSLR
jgi:hypothetical protein